LTVRASLSVAQAWQKNRKTLSNPDLLPAVQLMALADLEITPGQIDRLHSDDSEDLLVQVIPPVP